MHIYLNNKKELECYFCFKWTKAKWHEEKNEAKPIF